METPLTLGEIPEIVNNKVKFWEQIRLSVLSTPGYKAAGDPLSTGSRDCIQGTSMAEDINNAISPVPARTTGNRIAFIDGLRGVAILLVIGYHYYTRWAPRGYYPYDDALAAFPVFAFGHYGVSLFFAVSGFVIAMTLERTRSVPEFAVRRFARLWPAMFLCSSITFVFLTWQPLYFPQSPRNFLSSWTFISGSAVWSRVFPGFNSGWIDGAYWSLFVEVRFYALAAICYYMCRERFVRVFSVGAASVVAVYCLSVLHDLPAVVALVGEVTIAPYLPWFTLGLSMHERWSSRSSTSNQTLALSIFSMALLAVADSTWSDVVAHLLVTLTFLGCMRYEAMNRIFAVSWLTFIGLCSYSLYLLHQYIGVTAISLIASGLSLGAKASQLLPVLVAAGLLLVARLIYQYWEVPWNKRIVERYRRHQNDRAQEQAA